MSVLVAHRIAALLGALSAPLAAQPTHDAAILQRPAGASGALGSPAGPVQAWRRDGPAHGAKPSLSTLTVVELPPENGLPNGRRHHALSIPFDGARQAARQLGVDVTECAVQLRMPARIARDRVAGARATMDVQAQVRLACRM